MASPASAAKHPVHPMLIVFPVGLLVFSLICNLIYVLGARDAVWSLVALYTMGGGIIGGLLAAVPGLIDFTSITDPVIRAIGWRHMLANVTGLVLFIIAFWRQNIAGSTNVVIVLSILAVISLAIGGWLGGEMVYVRGLGVERVEQLERERAILREPMRREPMRRVG